MDTQVMRHRILRYLESAEANKRNRQTSVAFHSTDPELQRLFEAAETKATENIAQFNPTIKVMTEGGGFDGVYLETQPMGGEMYAKRDLEIALNNQMVFMLAQREDGRIPGCVRSVDVGRNAYSTGGKWLEGFTDVTELGIVSDFRALQGYCFPTPAWKLNFWLGQDREYLEILYTSLEAFDEYLWKTHDTNGDGLLETWTTWDTGEDGDPRLTKRGVPTSWPFDRPPGSEGLPSPQNADNYRTYWSDRYEQRLEPPAPSEMLAPITSLIVNGYSISGRIMLAKLSQALANGRESYWEEKADALRNRVNQTLWKSERHAAFDLDRNGNPVDVLTSGNFWAGMYFEIFTQPMADEFVRHHLLNPDEFWTPFGLACFALNEPEYCHLQSINYCHGLQQQRAIRALENYGHYAEASMLGDRLHKTLARNGYTFSGGVGVRTGEAASWGGLNYGPMLLTTLEYFSHLHGVHLDEDRVWWSGLRPEGHDFKYVQQWGNRLYELTCANGILYGRLNDREVFTCTAGVRIVTDIEGNMREVVGIHPKTQRGMLSSGGDTWQLDVAPNYVYGLSGKSLNLLSAVPFDYLSDAFFGPLPLPGPPQLSDDFVRWQVTSVCAGEEIADLPQPHLGEQEAHEQLSLSPFVNLHDEWKGKSGHAAFFGYVDAEEVMDVEMRLGYDGPFRIWLADQEVHVDLHGTNPAIRDEHRIPLSLLPGRTPLTILMATNNGQACGFFLRMARPYAEPAFALPKPWR